MQRHAKLTTKGRITVPHEIRRLLGVHAGDSLLFETGRTGIRVKPIRHGSRFAKYRGIGHPGIPSGRQGVRRWLRDLRGR